MPCYAITFGFRDDAGATLRRASLLSAIGRCERVWDGTESFALVETAEPMEALATRLYLDSDLNALKDRLVVIELGTQAVVARGTITDQEGLRALLSRVAFA